MSNLPFSWSKWKKGLFPLLEDHSEAKLNILADYIEAYVLKLYGNVFGADSVKITIVDGFAGGGVYANEKLGSPFVLLKAIKLAETRLTAARRTPLRVDAHFYFVEEKKSAVECLRHHLGQSDYSAEIGKSIFIIEGRFHDHWRSIVGALKRRQPKGGRVIFFLDQCGYTQVSALLVHEISKALSMKAEFLINIAISWFTDRMKDDDEFFRFYESLGIGGRKDFDCLVALKEKREADWRFLIEAEVGTGYRKASGAPYWSPFFVKPEGRHRGYWLLHLAPHSTARLVMADVQWKHGCSFSHYGTKGLRMLSYDPELDKEAYLEGFSFDAWTRKESQEKLVIDLSAQIRNQFPEGITLHELYRVNCNDSIADLSLFRDSLKAASEEHHEIKILGPGGGAKRTVEIGLDDILSPNNQVFLPLFGKPKVGI